MNNKKGFTLIELIVTITIIGLIGLIAIPSTKGLIDKSKQKAYDNQIDIIIKTAENYVIGSEYEMPTKDNQKFSLLVDELVESKEISNDEILNPQTGEKIEGCVIFTFDIDTKKYDTTFESACAINKNEEESLVGNYIDYDADGEVDGIIFADLLTGAIGDGSWGTKYGTYKIPVLTNNIKDYYVTKQEYDGDFGIKKVISPVSSSKGEDRFYILGLETLNNSEELFWYYGAYGNMDDHDTYTSENFGSGKENTERMIVKWKESGYGEQNKNSTRRDVWGIIDEYVNDGWFIPSREEWAAFGGEILEPNNITTTNYTDYNLPAVIWSSSQNLTTYAYRMFISSGTLGNSSVNNYNYVRFARTA